MPRFDFFAPIQDYWLDNVFNHYVASSKKILKHIEIKPSDSVLDIGGGTGTIGNLIRTATGAQVVVADPSEKLIERGKQKFSQVKFVTAQAEYLPFPDDSFDVVLMIGVLHFAHSPELALKEASRVLKKDGKLFLCDLNFSNPLTKFIWRPVKSAVISKTTAFTPDEVDAFLAKNGFRRERHYTSGLLFSAVKI